jgi:hypothetical protein
MGDGRDHRDHREQPVKRVTVRARWRGKIEWRPDPGPGYDLRQYRGGRPTGRVAVVGWDDRDAARSRTAVGPDVWLGRERSLLVIEEFRHRGAGPAARLRLPIRSCVDARLAAEPGLPGNALVRLTLTLSIGAATIILPLWFQSRSQPFLQTIVDDVVARPGGVGSPTADTPMPTVPPLDVVQAPDNDDWIVFRPADHGEVLLPHAAGPDAAPLGREFR